MRLKVNWTKCSLQYTLYNNELGAHLSCSNIQYFEISDSLFKELIKIIYKDNLEMLIQGLIMVNKFIIMQGEKDVKTAFS